MFVTRHTQVIDPVMVDKLWATYEVAFAPLAETGATREMMYRSEFESSIADPTNRLWVVWDDDRPVAMSLIATDIAATRWLSRAYFERQYPDLMRAGLIHYGMWIAVHPAYVARGALIHLAKHGLALEASEGAVLVFDVEQANQPNDEGGLAEMMIRLAKMVGEVKMQHLSTQRYYALEFTAPGAPREELAEQREATSALLRNRR